VRFFCKYAEQNATKISNDLRQITERFCAKLPIKIQKMLKILHMSQKSSTFAAAKVL